MNILTKLLMLPVARRVVEGNTLPEFREILETELEANGFSPSEISDWLVERFLNEALVRAAINEADGCPRYGVMYRQVETLAGDAGRIRRGDKNIDEKIRVILNHHEEARKNKQPDAK